MRRWVMLSLTGNKPVKQSGGELNSPVVVEWLNKGRRSRHIPGSQQDLVENRLDRGHQAKLGRMNRDNVSNECNRRMGVE